RAPRTVIDLVADTGISTARAQTIYRFWLANDLHPAAENARSAQATRSTTRRTGTGTAEPEPAQAPGAQAAAMSTERRARERLERDRLIGELRHADPVVRAQAFETLKTKRKSG